MILHDLKTNSSFIKYLKYKNKYLKLGGGISTGKNNEFTINSENTTITIDNTKNILSYIKYNADHTIINLINIRNNRYNYPIDERNRLYDNIYIISTNDRLKLHDQKKFSLEIMLKTNIINYFLYYNNNNIKLFTYNGDFTKIFKICIYINTQFIIIIELNECNTINFSQTGNNINTLSILNISNINLKLDSNISNILCNPFTFNFLDNSTNIIDIISYNRKNLNIRTEIFNLLLFEDIYNYEESYDIFRNKYLQQYCKESNILLKNIYNSIFNLVYIKYNDFNEFNNSRFIIENLINNEFVKIVPNLPEICENDSKRIELLKNIIKRIPASFDFRDNTIQLKNNDGKFLTIQEMVKIGEDICIDNPETFKIVFDTGNGSDNLIGIDLVKVLGLENSITKTFTIPISGVSDTTDISDQIVNICLKFNDTSYSINKTYEFKAYIIDNENLKDTLLLGQKLSKGLKEFFDDKYSIYYDYQKEYNKYHTPEYIEATYGLTELLLNYLKSIYKTIETKSVEIISPILPELKKKLSLFVKYHDIHDENYQEIFTILTKFNKIFFDMHESGEIEEEDDNIIFGATYQLINSLINEIV